MWVLIQESESSSQLQVLTLLATGTTQHGVEINLIKYLNLVCYYNLCGRAKDGTYSKNLINFTATRKQWSEGVHLGHDTTNCP